MSIDPPEEIHTPEYSAERTGFGRRLGAFAIDIVIVSILTSVAGLATGDANSPESTGLHNLSDLTRLMAGVGLFAATLQFLYSLIEGVTGASPGKMILRIQIRDVGGAQAAIGTLILRMAVKHVKVVATFLVALTGSQMLTVVGLAGGLIVFFGCFLALGAARQALHDKMVQTAVFSTPARA